MDILNTLNIFKRHYIFFQNRYFLNIDNITFPMQSVKFVILISTHGEINLIQIYAVKSIAVRQCLNYFSCKLLSEVMLFCLIIQWVKYLMDKKAKCRTLKHGIHL
jgi:hypothetical protein